MTALIVVPPVQITDAVLVSTDVTEADYSAWSAVTSYGLAGRCIVTTGVHKIYESLQAANLNHAVTDTAWWSEVSPTNRWKCFDTSNSTQTAKATNAQYVVAPSQSVSAVGLLNITEVATMRVRMIDGTYGTVYDTTAYASYILADSSWYSFFIGAKRSLSSMTLTDLPNYPAAQITVDLVGTTNMAFGVLMFGQAQELGLGVSYGAKVSIQDYSRKVTNAYGDTVLEQRAYAKRANFSIQLSEGEFDWVTEWLTQYRSTPCLWIGSTSFTSTYVFGIYEGFENTINYGDTSICSLNLLGLT